MLGHPNRKLFSLARAAYNRRGIKYILIWGTTYVMNYFRFWYYKVFRSTSSFEFQGNHYQYFFHPYSCTWNNERAVEIPIVWDIVKKYRENNKNILEIGNVLSYRFKVDHDILDKYEIREGIINEDVVDFRPKSKYDLIVSISTLEHIGWDEEEKDSSKILRAVSNLRSMIASGGKIVATIPLGYNFELDALLKEKKLKFSEQYYLKKIGKVWKQVDQEETIDTSYDFNIPSARGLMVCIDMT